ncbi:S8 family serine peptidase [Guyparkeria hydrothermalis]|uniref:S8 family serine peptidase n=1 Tax=Guyparkeria hydrothermalis TaxID=923 RepID=UPI002020EC96|nr:S8 family serine peptidase [Guyparkeria hydrothermalis]MCL7743564.1 S8 family serine peptidase [Guyparkeria hydrothermalis]
MRPSRRVAIVCGSAAMALLLTACGGGGGGTAPPPSDSGTGTYTFTPVQPAETITESNSGEPNPSEVIAVIDTGLDQNHTEFQGDNPVGEPIVASTRDSCVNAGGCTDPNDTSDETGHGTAVASLIASRNLAYSGNSQLAVYDISDESSGDAEVGSITQALSDVVDNGNRVANLSYAVDMIRTRQAYGVLTDERLQIDRFVNSGAVLISSAGNTAESYSDIVGSSWDADSAELNSMIDQYLVVGALADDELASYSNVAGSNSLVQSRFLVTQGSHTVAIANSTPDAYGTGTGTSFAAPIVSAAMATILSKWDHFTPAEAAQRLLDTTDREFANRNDSSSDNYGDSSCGASNDTDCGLYTYGQGRLDIEAALAPEGVVSVATTASVPDGSNPDAGSSISTSGLVLPAGLGDTAEQIATAASRVEVFDELGRNYTADLSSMVQTATDPTSGLGYRMSRFLSAGLGGEAFGHDPSTGTTQRVRIDGAGRLNLASIGTDRDTHGINVEAYHFGHGSSAPDAEGSTGMAMVFYAGNTPMANQIDSANGMSIELPIAPRLSLTSRYWQGEKRLSLDPTGQADRLSNLALGLKAELLKGINLTAGYASLDESAGFLGMSGMGGFSTRAGSDMGLMQLGIDARFGGLSAFASFQTGHAEAGFERSLIRRIEADVEQLAIGAAYAFDHGRKQIALVASQPMHLTGGTAEMKLATDRTRDGDVVYRHESIPLSAAHTPTNYEIGYRQRLGKKTLLGINAMRMENAPSQSDGNVDHGAMAIVGYQF